MTHATPTWRLIVDERPFDGAWNMALDRAMQLEHALGEAAPTLRLYAWARPTVTIGRFQPAEEVDLDVCRDEGIDVARRFTGGRGVLHDREVTYSVIGGVRDGIPRGTTASYRHLCRALVAAYEELGVAAGLTSRPRGPKGSAACYLHATHADVSLGALKLSGSAQVWHRDTVLQHGSFVIGRDLVLEARVFGLTDEETAALAGTTATLADTAGATPSGERIAGAVRAGFERALGVTFDSAGPTPGEEALAATLLTATEVLVRGPARPALRELQA